MAACVAVVVAAAVRPWIPELPEDLDYARHYGYTTPIWITLAGAGAGIAAMTVLTTWRRRVGLVLASVAAFLLLWTSGGLVLDGFRAFFNLTGIPAGTFSVVDWRGAAVRAAALGAAAVLVAVLLADRKNRVAGGAWLGYTACALAFVYPLLKIYWAAGGAFLRPAGYDETLPVAEMIMLVGGGVLSLLLVQRWGRVLPSWLPLVGEHSVPRLLPITTGWLVSAVLLNQGLLPVFGLLNSALLRTRPVFVDAGASVWAVGVVYLGWALFGLALAGATLAYQQQTRR
ncbi:hypothetical protein SAMN05216215_100488 [Saccharopolyspora shandongensis]|uniref:Uncharacterized protein n=1 Tax=Saccharopolyspora shandongensis TaxID=418495 RepID=A0A1H2UV67_9PSEU|nr:hypothetical protein [Saccharopolyspora shandongensis]SDW59479.1 hypothetical protein SAMN05216215_100488 [Saccharopolyspora shandongensis]